MPSEVRFAELQRLLESYGYTLVRITGSHHVFHKPGERPIPIPVHHGKVKHVYLRKVQKIVGAN
ncbi:MAG TPA: type II toxin-antitoxin system HicA family toxin [Phycisphaerae bacterium]|nr:type II toxin-antitoxin system HicA family toxin [Phycisphaerae bacterium]